MPLPRSPLHRTLLAGSALAVGALATAVVLGTPFQTLPPADRPWVGNVQPFAHPGRVPGYGIHERESREWAPTRRPPC